MSKYATRKKVMDIINSFSGSEAVVPIPRIFIDMCGDYNRAAILNQILYWSERTTDRHGWFYKSATEWEKETGLTRYQVKRAIEGDQRTQDNSQVLGSMGVETMVRKTPKGVPTTHYRIDEDTFLKALMAAINNHQDTLVNNVENQNLNNVEDEYETLSQIDDEQCCISLYTENTSENTTDITSAGWDDYDEIGGISEVQASAYDLDLDLVGNPFADDVPDRVTEMNLEMRSELGEFIKEHYGMYPTEIAWEFLSKPSRVVDPESGEQIDGPSAIQRFTTDAAFKEYCLEQIQYWLMRVDRDKRERLFHITDLAKAMAHVDRKNHGYNAWLEKHARDVVSSTDFDLETFVVPAGWDD